jgi:hypothetical protein
MRDHRRSQTLLPLAVLVLMGMMASTAPAGAQEAPPQVEPPPGPGWNIPTANPTGLEPRAIAMLQEMSDYLLGLGAFSFSSQSTVDVVAETGQKIQMVGHTDVLVRRPDRLWLLRRGPTAQVEGFHDGKTATMYDKQHNYYATKPAPATLDGLLDMAQDEIGVDLPGADFLYSNLYEGLMWDTQSGFYVGLAFVGGVPAHHLAFRGKEIDWQIWIEDGERPVPLKFLITRKWYTGAPEIGVELTNWNVSPKATDDAFAFRPPAGAMKTVFWKPGGNPVPSQ